MSKNKTLRMASTEAENFVNFERRKYAREWEASSAHLAGQDAYVWMAEKLAVSGHILEIGCGTGRSTTELLRRGNKVIAVEENANCASRARDYVQEVGYRVKFLSRGSFRSIDSQSHAISYGAVRAP